MASKALPAAAKNVKFAYDCKLLFASLTCIKFINFSCSLQMDALRFMELSLEWSRIWYDFNISFFETILTDSILGLLWHDQYFEPAPEVTEALRRLNLKEPWLFDQRKMRLSRAHTLAMHNERLPKDQWTKWDEETFYLKPYLDEIETEKKERARSSGLIPGYLMRKDSGAH